MNELAELDQGPCFPINPIDDPLLNWIHVCPLS